MTVSELFNLGGRTAVVTGGGGALGTEVARALAGAGAGAVVAVVDLHPARSQSVADDIAASGGTAFAFSGDLSDPNTVTEVFAAIDDRLGAVDILVNAISAPVRRFAPEEFPVAAWQEMLDNNLTSYFLCGQAAARSMIAAGKGGSIIHFGSIAGVSALGRGNVAYGVAKGGIVQLTRETALAWAGHNIRVNSILPSQFLNEMWATALADEERSATVDRVLSGIPLGRLGRPEEIVGPVLFLAGDAASMVTGVSLPVDGGNLAMNAGATIEW